MPLKSCHCEECQRRSNPLRLLRGVYPEQNNEILPPYLIRGQNDKKRRVRNDSP